MSCRCTVSAGSDTAAHQSASQGTRRYVLLTTNEYQHLLLLAKTHIKTAQSNMCCWPQMPAVHCKD